MIPAIQPPFLTSCRGLLLRLLLIMRNTLQGHICWASGLESFNPEAVGYEMLRNILQAEGVLERLGPSIRYFVEACIDRDLLFG